MCDAQFSRKIAGINFKLRQLGQFRRAERRLFGAGALKFPVAWMRSLFQETWPADDEFGLRRQRRRFAESTFYIE
jgi:hypothetical protein